MQFDHRLTALDRVSSSSVLSGAQGAASGVPANTDTGRHSTSAQVLFAFRRSTTTPTEIRVRAVDINSRPPYPGPAIPSEDFVALSEVPRQSSLPVADAPARPSPSRSCPPDRGTTTAAGRSIAQELNRRCCLLAKWRLRYASLLSSVRRTNSMANSAFLPPARLLHRWRVDAPASA